MLNKKTVIIFTDASRASTASAIKEGLLAAEKDCVVIIIDDLELHAVPLRDYIEKVFKLKVNFDRNRAIKEEKRLSKNIDVTPKSDATFKQQLSYKKMENIFNRYTPDFVVTIGYGAFNEAIATRNQLGSKAKVVAVIPDYALNKQLINVYMDGYVVQNMAVKTTLVNNYVKEGKIVLADIPVSRALLKPFEKKKAREELKLEEKLPTLLYLCNGGAPRLSEMLAELKAVNSSYNVLCYAGANREAFAQSVGAGLEAFNEGADLNRLIAAADIVLTPPTAYYVAAARMKKNILVLAPAAEAIERKNAVYLENCSVDCSSPDRLRVFLKQYPDGDYKYLADLHATETVGDCAQRILDFGKE